ncbi:MAG: prepilin-type N-terminal cleavage/methylation domain-containing protein [Pyrinomonadaceae bacterium]
MAKTVMKPDQRGFSLIELMVVLVVVTIFVSISLFFYEGHRSLYRPDETALLVGDLLQEARQRSLTQRETMRVEVDLTRKVASLIDENRSTTADDDVVIRAVNIPEPSVVTVGSRPANIPDNPPEPLPVPNAVFVSSVYTPSFGNNVATFRFLRDGSVVNAGNNSIGTGATASGATLHIWSPSETDATSSQIARAITIIGSSGTIRTWEYDPALETTNKWKDSRRSGSYAGTTTGNANN